MPANTRYVPKHRAMTRRAHRNLKRMAALGATVPAALGGSIMTTAPAQAADQGSIDQAWEVARNQKGDPYEYGAEGPDAFDCSGLIYYSYGKAGIDMPRSSDAQADRARRIAKEDMRPGDLMFFYDEGGVYHVGIFGGWNGNERRWVLHSPQPGEDVHHELVWTNDWFAGTMRGA